MEQDLRKAIILVEDQPEVRGFISDVLSRAGFLVLASGDTGHGLNDFRENRERVVLAILDMVLPGDSGLDLAAQFSREAEELKILYISGYSSSVAMDGIRRRSPDAVLIKPFSATALIARVWKLAELDGEPPNITAPLTNSAGGASGGTPTAT